MNYQFRLQRDLNALGSVEKEQAVTGMRLLCTMLTLPLAKCFMCIDQGLIMQLSNNGHDQI